MIDAPPQDPLGRSMLCFESECRLPLLAKLASELTVSGRSSYPPPDSAAYLEDAPRICHNELLHVVADQLRTDLGGRGRGYPDPALIQTLIDKARIWGCEGGLWAALKHALSAMAAPKPIGYDGPASDLVARSVERLGSGQRLPFLANLAVELTVEARSAYPEPGTDAYRTGTGFICHNELLHAVTDQLRGGLAGGTDSSDPAFLPGLAQQARALGCADHLDWALARSLAAVSRP